MIRKFFDPAATAEPATQTQQPSIAELMAKSGTMSMTGSPQSEPIIISTEKKEDPAPAKEPEPAVTATPTQTAEPAKPEPPSQPAAAEPATEPQKEPAPEVKQPTLQEVLRQHQPAAILKELGYDDKVVNELKELDPKMVAFLNHWKQNGDVTAFLRELSTDYSKMPAEDVMRHQLQRDYPRASPQQIEVLYKAKVVNAYNLNSEIEEEQAEGRMLLEAEADKYRDTLTQKQQEFLLPKPPEPKAPEPDLSEQVAVQEFEKYRSSVNDHPYTKNIVANKVVTLGDGDEKFTFPVDPQVLTNILYNSKDWNATMFDEQGNANVEHQLLVATVAKYGKSFFTEMAKHYKSLGGNKVVDTLENASEPNQNKGLPAQAEPTSPAQAMAKYGRLS